MFVPVGNATLLAGIYKGLREFRRFGLIHRFPRLVAVQSERCNPFTRAYGSGRPIRYVKPKTIADAIAVGYPTFGFEGLKALKATKGLSMEVSEQEIENAVLQLRRLGIGSETGGASSFAGYLKLCRTDAGLEGKRVVVIVSGNN